MIEYRIRDTSTMLKLFYVIFMNLHRAPYMIPRMRAEANIIPGALYARTALFARCNYAIYPMNKTGKINTAENRCGKTCQSREGTYMSKNNYVLGNFDITHSNTA